MSKDTEFLAFYNELEKLPMDNKFDSKKLISSINSINNTEPQYIIIGPNKYTHLDLIYVIALHHYITRYSAKVKGVYPYGSKPLDHGKGTTFIMDKVPVDLQHVLYKYIKLISSGTVVKTEVKTERIEVKIEPIDPVDEIINETIKMKISNERSEQVSERSGVKQRKK